MTNTETVPTTMTPEQKLAYRTDESGFLSDLFEVGARYRVVRLGAFIPGSAYTYAAMYVLRLIGEEYVVHTMVRMDDSPGPVNWMFNSGSYTRDLARAVALLNERG